MAGTNTHDEARKVKGFDTSVIREMTAEEQAYLEDYNERINDDDLMNNPLADENLKFFAHVMIYQANSFKDIAAKIEGDDELSIDMRKNYEDMAEANWLKFLEVEAYM